MIQCPGCGGRNPRNAQICDWCRRSFLAEPPPRGHSTRWWVMLSLATITLLLVALGLLSAVSSARQAPRVAAATPTSRPLPPLPVVVPTATQPAPRDEPTSVAAAPTALAAPAQPTPGGRLATVVNTANQGANLRQLPDRTSPVVTTVPESSTVRIVGPEQRAPDGTVWVRVNDQHGHEGWVLSVVLVESPR
jgi:hypothetical protein